jgi:multidrug efflux system membrane fusion protein
VDQTTGTIVMKARFANSRRRAHAGQFVNVRLPTTRIADACSVPVTALQNSPTGPFLFVLKPDGTVEQRGVTRARPPASAW